MIPSGNPEHDSSTCQLKPSREDTVQRLAPPPPGEMTREDGSNANDIRGMTTLRSSMVSPTKAVLVSVSPLPVTCSRCGTSVGRALAPILIVKVERRSEEIDKSTEAGSKAAVTSGSSGLTERLTGAANPATEMIAQLTVAPSPW